mmetsp:Transcript_32141/g.96865  ORF Transcript_32141/g.96865 Transcript_32141/m.96865 type:complete len:352 (-) Transcript_32141:175-1230(-)
MAASAPGPAVAPGFTVQIETLTEEDEARFEAAMREQTDSDVEADAADGTPGVMVTAAANGAGPEPGVAAGAARSSPEAEALRNLETGPHYCSGARMLKTLTLGSGGDGGRRGKAAQRHTKAIPPITRTNIKEDGSCFVLHNFLSAAECADVIAQAEVAGLRSVNADGYPRSMRVTSKANFWGFEAAQRLFERVQPELGDGAIVVPSEDMDLASERGVCVAVPGTYHPYGCNPVLRVCRYTAGGHFQPHRDGGFQLRAGENTSIKTLMVYLNDDFEGGATSFYTDSQECYALPEDKFRTYAFRPKAGDCLVFNSAHVHDGGKVSGGKKYILRSEVMYYGDAVAAATRVRRSP